ncbi:MAG: hypothetical protein LJE65_05655 [Desulfobacteraceae bacterium]|jgi:hypothetical protein|nr:hypothetical protein [Desulfobacteraceae bacterium]
MESDSRKDRVALMQLRACILDRLYRFFREFPYGAMELEPLQDHCGTDAETLNWNLVYLEMCGYVELGRGVEAWPYVACSAAITATGIELVEDSRRFRARFGSPSPSAENDTG